MQKINFISQLLVFPLSLGAIAVLPHTALAQTQYQGDNNTQQPAPYQNSEQDPMKSMMGGALNPLDLMHRAQTGRSRNGSDFADDTQQSLSKAAANFKKMQQQQLQQQSGQLTQSGSGTTPKTP